MFISSFSAFKEADFDSFYKTDIYYKESSSKSLPVFKGACGGDEESKEFKYIQSTFFYLVNFSAIVGNVFISSRKVNVTNGDQKKSYG